jgi:hypothetical protein
MKNAVIVLTAVCLAASAGCAAAGSLKTFICGRDAVCVQASVEPPCEFPPVLNPCAVGCRPPVLQKPMTPCAFTTACPSITSPCYGVSYTDNPYPLFK